MLFVTLTESKNNVHFDLWTLVDVEVNVSCMLLTSLAMKVAESWALCVLNKISPLILAFSALTSGFSSHTVGRYPLEKRSEALQGLQEALWSFGPPRENSDVDMDPIVITTWYQLKLVRCSNSEISKVKIWHFKLPLKIQ